MSVNPILIEVVSCAERKEFGMLPAEENDKRDTADTPFNQKRSFLYTNRSKLFAENSIFHFFGVANSNINYMDSLRDLKKKTLIKTLKTRIDLQKQVPSVWLDYPCKKYLRTNEKG